MVITRVFEIKMTNYYESGINKLRNNYKTLVTKLWKNTNYMHVITNVIDKIFGGK